VLVTRCGDRGFAREREPRLIGPGHLAVGIGRSGFARVRSGVRVFLSGRAGPRGAFDGEPRRLPIEDAQTFAIIHFAHQRAKISHFGKLALFACEIATICLGAGFGNHVGAVIVAIVGIHIGRLHDHHWLLRQSDDGIEIRKQVAHRAMPIGIIGIAGDIVRQIIVDKGLSEA